MKPSDEKYWVYIKNMNGLVRVFDQGNGKLEICLRCASEEDMKSLVSIFEKIGHKDVDSGMSTSLFSESKKSKGETYY